MMDDDDGRQRDLDDLDDGMDVQAILQRQVDEAEVDLAHALAELRAVMTDAQVLEEFGIDLSETQPPRW